MIKLNKILKEEYRSTESFNFLTRNYDISKAKQIIRQKMKNGTLDWAKINVEEWYDQIQSKTKEGNMWAIKPGVVVNQKKAMKVKLNHPIIIVVDTNFTYIIDGWHRLYKAHTLGIKTLPVYVIDNDEDIQKIKL